MPQLQLLVVPHESTFGQHCAQVLKEAKAKDPTISWERVAEIIEAERTKWFPEKEPRIARDALLTSFVVACGQNIKEMTPPAVRLAAVSLAQIKKICPALTATEILKRVSVYRKKYREAAITPRAVALHWGELGSSAAPEPPRVDLHKEPVMWQSTLRAMGEHRGWDSESVEDYCKHKWLDLPITIRAEIVKHG